MIQQNKVYQKIWPEIKNSGKLILFCNKLLLKLTMKEQLFINLYYWSGENEKTIAPKLGFKTQQAVSLFQIRTFAKIRMFADKYFVFQPGCIKNLEEGSNTFHLFDVYKKLQTSVYINKTMEEAIIKNILTPSIIKLISYIDHFILTCGRCTQSSSCKKKIIKKNNSNVKKYPKIYLINKPVDNLFLIKKSLQYLLDWKIYD